MKRDVLSVVLLTGLLMWQCSGTESDISLKSSLDKGISRVNLAASVISKSKGFELMTVNDMTKSGDGYSDSINLEQIAGVL
ncbi:MAG: hypothetical protein QUS66_12045 [Bacteroidota bacterium]|nr:hypothetical protein [Bacteroidota bacterium]